MKSFGHKPWVLPQPVLILGTYNNDGTPNTQYKENKRNEKKQK